MSKSISDFIRRGQELGLSGTLHRIWARGMKLIVTPSRSLWWGWKARNTMSDAELLAQTTGEWTTVDALLDHLAGRPTASFLLPHETPQETASFLNHNYPEYIFAFLVSADAACRNEFSLLGREFHYPNGIDWHSDPITNYQWPLLHISGIDECLWSPSRPADYRLLWELNRHQHFITLGIAYWLTGDQKYVDVFCSHIQGWIETNPVQHGINWYSSLEVSLRLIAWTVAFQFFRSSPKFQQEVEKSFFKSLWQQAIFLSDHLQSKDKNAIPNNHLIGELVGQILVGVAFPEFRAATAWRDTGLDLLARQVVSQTHPDGVNKEQATGYHRFVAEFLLLIMVRIHAGELDRQPALERTLEHMLNYMMYSITPQGTSGIWGDADFGRVLGLGKNKDFWDFRSILSAGAVLFRRPDWKFAAGQFDVEAFWLLGSKGFDLWKQLDAHQPVQISRAFQDAGMYIIRDTWDSHTDIAFFRCGPFGLGGEGYCAHSHCDLLSLVLWIGGKPLLVDSGTYTYHGPWRDYFRLTAAHNTVMINNREQAVLKPDFGWTQIPRARCAHWSEKFVSGALTYTDEVEFVRELMHPAPGVWELVDKFSGHGGDHELTWFFHFAKNLALYMDDVSKKLIVEAQGKPIITVLPPRGVHLEIGSGWYSYIYGQKELVPVLQASWKGEVSSDNVSFGWKFTNMEKDHKENKEKS